MSQTVVGKPLKLSTLSLAIIALGFSSFSFAQQNTTSQMSYPIVDSNQTKCSNEKRLTNSCPTKGQTGYGQDAQYQGNAPSYTRNNDGTVTDNVTGLIWAQTIDTNGDGKITASDKMTYDQGFTYAANLNLAGHDDWRLPSIKELYSLILFDGEDPSGISGSGDYTIRPFINHRYFGFHSGDTDAGERLIDSQYLSSTKYVSTTMRGDETVFGVNFIDGRIKGYGMTAPNGKEKTFYLLAVRGNSDYGINQFSANSNGTISDQATGLIWQQNDSAEAMDWPTALTYCENLQLADRSDWRLPNAKELQSIVDYNKSPDTSNSAAIDDLFHVTSIINEGGVKDYPNYWSSTTHQNLRNSQNASYVSFGRSLGYIGGNWRDVHGAGAQRSDPKVDNGQEYPQGHGPQGDAVRFNNFVRCVTDSSSEFTLQPTSIERETKHYTLTEQDASVDNNPNSNSRNKSQSKQNGHPSASSQGKGGGRGGDPFVDLDSNKDGKLSRAEVKGPLQRDFDRLDRNNDNYLTRDELPKRR